MKHRKQRVERQRENRGPVSKLPLQLPLSPNPNSSIPYAIISRRSSHPTVYRKRIQDLSGNPKPGDWVRVLHSDTESGRPEAFGYGIYNPKSEVAIRLMSWQDQLPDDVFWNNLLDRAVALRVDALRLDDCTDCYRVVHAEADGLPGLAIDRYGDCLSAEVFSAAMAPRVEQILQGLSQRLGTRHWLIGPSPHLKSQEGFDLASRSSSDLPRQVVVTENATQYRVHFGTGHKTGFFCDQRDNRLRLAQLCRNRSVLDVCCYTGGFSVMAAKLGGASEITGIDLDEAPLLTARQNATLNQVRNVKFTQADAFAYMRDMLRLGRTFDIVVLDPPKLIRNRGELEEGTKKHFDLNRLAIQLVKPGGLMLTCSCAGLLPESEFSRLVRAAARAAFRPSEFNPQPTPRDVQIIAKSGAAACHPISANCPETEYLKSLWLRV